MKTLLIIFAMVFSTSIHKESKVDFKQDMQIHIFLDAINLTFIKK